MYFVAFGPRGATPEKLAVFAALVIVATAAGLYAARKARVAIAPAKASPGA
jgi:hypothetical protein